MIICVAILALLFQTTDSFQTTNSANPKVWIDNNEVWLQSPSGPRQLTSDSILKRLPTLAPDGKRLAYVGDRPSPDARQPAQELVFEIDIGGKPLRQITPKGYVPEQFDRLEWIDDQRIGAMACGHANCMYWIMDADSGQTIKVLQGGFDFIWSHDRRWVARRFEADTPAGQFETLKLNEAQAYPAAADSDMIAWAYGHQPEHAHNLGPFNWSPHDVWLAFTDSQSVDEMYVVLASPSGVIVRQKLPIPATINVRAEWTDDAHLQLVTGSQLLKFVVIGSELQQLAQ